MRGENNIAEDLEIRRSKRIFNNKFIKATIVLLIFVILSGLCFNLVYSLSFYNIEKNNNNDKNANNSNKIYIIEQKLRKDLEKMNSSAGK